MNGASVKELAQEFDVSEMTIRRDLKLLEEKKIVDNFYGAAVYNPRNDNPLNGGPDNNLDYDINLNSRMMEFEKNKIGKKAVELINDDDIVIIDAGTTTEKLSQNIPTDRHFTALVYSANNLMHLFGKRNVKLFMPGGVFHRETGIFESSEGLNLINNIRATKLFLSAAGVHDRLGITCAYKHEIETKKSIIKNSLEVILLVDSSKFGSVRSAFVCDLDYIDKVITDSNIDEEWLNILKEKEIEVILV